MVKMIQTKNAYWFLLMVFLSFLNHPLSQMAESPRVRVLIVDGRNNHDWKVTTDALRAALTATKRFDVAVSTAPQNKIHFAPRTPKSPADTDLERFNSIEAVYKQARNEALKDEQEAWDQWSPDFSAHDTVILNYNGPAWPKRVQTNLVNYVRNGGGLVLVHASNNGFRDWSAFNDMIGFGYNGHRGLQKNSPPACIKIDDNTGKTYLCCEGTNSGHGSMHPFKVKVRQSSHSIMQGIPSEWMHGRDELYHHLRGAGKNTTILSSAWSDPKTRGTGYHEPITWTVNYGQGRVVVTTMGHFWPRQTDFDSLYCVGFQTIIARSTEFVATGSVTIPVPANFPTKDKTSIIAPHLVAWNQKKEIDQEEPAWRKRKQRNPFAMLSPRRKSILPITGRIRSRIGRLRTHGTGTCPGCVGWKRCHVCRRNA